MFGDDHLALDWARNWQQRRRVRFWFTREWSYHQPSRSPWAPVTGSDAPYVAPIDTSGPSLTRFESPRV
jgi:hypothetical protein